MNPRGSATVFHVTDMERSVEFYSSQLGFAVDFRHGDPVSYTGMSWGNIYIHLGAMYPYRNNTGHGNLYIMLDEVDSLYDDLIRAGVELYCPIGDRGYGLRDFAIKDPDGNQISIGAMLGDAA